MRLWRGRHHDIGCCLRTRLDNNRLLNWLGWLLITLLLSSTTAELKNDLASLRFFWLLMLRCNGDLHRLRSFRLLSRLGCLSHDLGLLSVLLRGFWCGGSRVGRLLTADFDQTRGRLRCCILSSS